LYENNRPKLRQLIRAVILSAALVCISRLPARADWLPDEILNYPQDARFVEYQAVKLATRLEESGLEKIAAWEARPAVQIKSLRADFATIEYLQLPEFFKPPGASRWTAFHEFGQRRIYVNSGARLDSIVSDTLAFHEAMGALGYAEPDYQVSILVSLYARTARDLSLSEEERAKSLVLLRKILEAPLTFSADPNPQNRILRRESGQGGGDIVGGGGDGDALSFKLQLLERIERVADSEQRIALGAQVAKLALDVVDKTASPQGIEITDSGILRIERARFELSSGRILRLPAALLSYAQELLRARGLLDGP
jgi:hypothetical protein